MGMPSCCPEAQRQQTSQLVQQLCVQTLPTDHKTLLAHATCHCTQMALSWPIFLLFLEGSAICAWIGQLTFVVNLAARQATLSVTLCSIFPHEVRGR
jgi:hypothetical protein